MDRFRRPAPLLNQSWGQPLDRVSLLVMLTLSIAIVAFLVLGDRTAPRVRDFSWQDQQIGAEDRAFILTFNRPMDHDSVEANLQLHALVPNSDSRPIPGKISWAGQRMAYTLENPAPYGYEFELILEQARDRFSRSDGAIIDPFFARFRSRDRAFLYIGVDGEDEGHLILYNLTRKQKRVLTPKDLVVQDYESYPDGDRVLFSATSRTAQRQGILDQKLYVVSTGLDNASLATSTSDPAIAPDNGANATNGTNATNGANATNDDIAPLPPPTLLLDSRDYQNLSFDLSPDGQTIVVNRVNRQDPTDFGLWVLRPEQTPTPLETEPGGDFLIAPDSQTIAHLQGEGLALLPLDTPAQRPANRDDLTTMEPMDFLPRYGMVLNFSADGAKAAMVQFSSEQNQPKRSLFLVTNRGTEEELLVTSGSILDAQFDPTGRFLYCLVTQLQASEIYIEQPYLIAINLETNERTDLLLLPQQQNIHMAVAPDGLGILFDQIRSTVDPSEATTLLRGDDGSLITSSQLWFFPISHDQHGKLVLAKPDNLPISGFSPQWVP
ncbi:MAG: hypothetical protein F6K30_18785 [Cyanothece sp. SIO2G6]|nr:hypothetical protein [Cyanothece sp. SIO2G6]